MTPAGRAGNGAARRARWTPLLVLSAFLALVGLGSWQLDRREWKTALLAGIEAQLAAPPVSLPAGAISADGAAALAYRRVSVSGVFLHEREMILLPRTYKGRAGAHVVTPFRLDDGRVLLVDRGWIPNGLEDPTRRAEGRIAGPVTVSGIVRAPPRQGWLTPDNRPGAAPRGEWYWIDIAAMGAAGGLRLLPLVIEADDAPNPGGYPIGGQTRINIPNNHLQYALTWYALAVIVAVMYAIHWRRARRARRG